MSSTHFENEVTHLPADWANDVNALTYDVFGAAKTVGAARAALGLKSMALQDSNNITVSGGVLDGVTLGLTEPKAAAFTTATVQSAPSASSVVPRSYVDSEINTLSSSLRSMAFQAATAVNIDGGTIDGTVIGGQTPAAGTFNQLRVTTAPAIGSDATNKDYVDGRFAALTSVGSLGTQQSDSVSITGGTIDETVIGAVTPAEAYFTRLHASKLLGAAYTLTVDGTEPGYTQFGLVGRSNDTKPNVGFVLGANGRFSVFDKAGTERAFVNDQGRVCIGTNDDGTSLLQVSGAARFNTINLSGAITAGSQATNKTYVDSSVNAQKTRIDGLVTRMDALGTMSAQSAATVNITGGQLNNVVIGSATPNTGKFTDLFANSITNVLSGGQVDLSPNTDYAVRISAGLATSPDIAVEIQSAGEFVVKAGSTKLMQVQGNRRILLNGAGDDLTSELQLEGDFSLTGDMVFRGVVQTGAGTAGLGNNCPAQTPTAPAGWLRAKRGATQIWLPFWI